MSNGGPAFPTDSEAQVGPTRFHYEGMTLRAYFAGQYLAGIMACPLDGAVGTPSDVAHEAVLHADALIEELNK